ncbi:hypothetical protein KUL17_11670 [Alteromonas sp. KUL17]|nr:hypothetical protein KUL17_11670 [Alteromonas sp. KUL17]
MIFYENNETRPVSVCDGSLDLLLSVSFFEINMSYSNTQDLVQAVTNSPDTIEFNDVIALIDSAFTFSPTAFTNGDVLNEANQNNGSCKLLALGQHLNLNQAQTLALFGRFYREDVLNNPNGDDHANIRNFMKTGHEGVAFETFPLKEESL